MEMKFLFECLTRDVELNTRREISYPQEAMYYFVYHINTIALYRQEKSTSLMNESKRIDNLRIKVVKCVGVGKMKKALKHYKNKRWA